MLCPKCKCRWTNTEVHIRVDAKHNKFRAICPQCKNIIKEYPVVQDKWKLEAD